MWTYPHYMQATDSRMEFTGGRPSQPIVLPPGAIVGTDGSGGRHSAEPRLRRCGWGVVVLDSERHTVAMGKGL